MNKIKEGDYVRIRDVDYDERIAKIEKVLDKDPCYKNMQMYRVDVFNHQPGCFSSFEIYKEDILKHSKNIIDLLEVGDIIVTAHPVFEKLCLEQIEDKRSLRYIKTLLKEKSIILKSVVTYQQFKEMEYEI